MIDTPTLPEDAVEVHGLRPYPEYKPSGVEWLGDIPSHWGMSALRYLGSKFGSGLTPRGGATTYVSNGVLFLRSQNIHFDGLRLDDVAHISMQVDEEMSNSRVRVGDVLLNITGASIGRCCVVPDGIARANVNQHVCIVRPKLAKADPRFINYHLRSAPVQHLIQEVSLGAAREGLTQDDLKAFPVPLPSLKEQRGIADFLDAMDERITRFIDARRRMITLLEEQKQAIINQAVTKGLDPDVPMKPSGIDWLGDIPAHWEVVSLARLISGIEQGWSPVAANDTSWDDDRWTVLTLSSVKSGSFISSARKPLQPGTVPDSRLRVVDGDFLLTRANTRSLVGDVAIATNVPLNLILSDLIYRLSLRVCKTCPEYFLYIMLSCVGRSQIERDARGSNETMVKINHVLIRSWIAPIPTIEEQWAIVERIRDQLTEVEYAMRPLRREVELMREYRTRLISDVVTGKLDISQTTRSK